jgi:putative transposase
LLQGLKGLIINAKKVYRLCSEMNILGERAPRKNVFPRKIAINRTVTASNQLWEMDIKYGYIEGEQRFFYMLSLIDVMDRSIIDYHIGASCLATDAIAVLKGSLMKRQLFESPTMPVIRTDNGPQFIAFDFEVACKELKVDHEHIPYKTPNKNAHIESFHAILQRECLSRYEFEDFEEAYKVVSDFMRRYNERRPHGSLKMHTPTKAFKMLIDGTLALKKVCL